MDIAVWNECYKNLWLCLLHGYRLDDANLRRLGYVRRRLLSVAGSIPPNQCDVQGASLDLNHGVLKVGAIAGSTVQATRQVKCTYVANVRYRVSEGNPFPVGLGVSTTLTVNGVKAGEMIKLPAGTSTLIIASTLTDNGAQAGEFSKTVVLIQSFM